MRLLPRLFVPCLAALLLTGASVRAEPASGWVDPPAKADAGKAEAAKPGDAKSGDGPASAEPAAAAAARDDRRADPHEGRFSRRAERRSVRRGASRRMAAPSEIDTTAPDPRFAAWAGRAQQLAGAYLDSVSAPGDAMIAAAPRFYGDRVRFHGRSMSLGALLAEKRRFVRRWPERRYEAQDGTMRTACNAAATTCIVRTVMGFRAESPARRARSQGLSELTLTVSFAGERPVIVSESSRVLSRGSAALGSAERGRNGGA